MKAEFDSVRRVSVNILYSEDYAEHEKTVRSLLEAYELVPVFSKDFLEPEMFLCNICKLIQTCKYGITDISEGGTNVFYELGLMHAVGIHCATLKDHRSKMMSDIGGLLFLEYTNLPSLKQKLEFWIRGQVQEAVIPSERNVDRSDITNTANSRLEGSTVYNIQGNAIIGTGKIIGRDDLSRSGLDSEEFSKLLTIYLPGSIRSPT